MRSYQEWKTRMTLAEFVRRGVLMGLWMVTGAAPFLILVWDTFINGCSLSQTGARVFGLGSYVYVLVALVFVLQHQTEISRRYWE